MKNQFKFYFLMINLFAAIFAFSYMTSADIVSPIASSPLPTGGGGCGTCGAGTIVSSVSSGTKTTTTVAPSGQPGVTTVQTVQGGIKQGVSSYFGSNLLQNLAVAGGLGIIGAFVGGWAGGKNGELWGFISFFAGATIYQILTPAMGMWAFLPGIGVGGLIFILTYKKSAYEQVEFNCLPWQAPVGGRDCELCNKLSDCSEYTCRSFGQACNIVNSGTPEQKCIWKNPYDTRSPVVELKKVSKGYKFLPDKAVRPPATGAIVSQDNGNCIKAFFALEFTLSTDEPSQCKIDYSLKNFSEMSFYVGGDNLFSYNHTEKLSLPGPDAINRIAPELKNDGSYALYIRCQDANGNVNVNPFSIKFCVERGPDTTAPYVVDVSVPSGSPIQYNKTSMPIEVYVNEPSECKWSKQDIGYDEMENAMSCDNNIWEMNSNEVYVCRATLNGLESRKDNKYYFKCKDQPYAEEASRNKMQESYAYTLIGTQPLNIISIGPSGNIYGATDSIPVFLEIKTDNGYNNGEATCYYSPSAPAKEDDYIKFLETKTNQHKQRQDLVTGNYNYYFKCVDLGGNAVYNSTSFRVETDKSSPTIVRVYKESGQLKIITNEKSECSYSVNNCNFEIESGIKMKTSDYASHNAEWKLNQNYFIRCKDKYSNQPDSNTCSIVVKASRFDGNAY